MIKYRIRNWAIHQHYKDRNPPWIKLHYELLSSKDWVTLDDASRVLAVACMLIASRNNGEVPSDMQYLKRVAYLNSDPDLSPLIDCGFIEALADTITVQANARPETETETEAYTEEETEIEKPVSNSESVLWSMPFETVWHAYQGIGRNGVLGSAYKGNKKPAQQTFFKILKHTLESDREVLIRSITNGCHRYAEHLKRSGYGCKYLSNWLEERGWETDYADSVQDDHVRKQRPGGNSGPSGTDTLFAAASAAQNRIRARDSHQGSAGEFQGFSGADPEFPGLNG